MEIFLNHTKTGLLLEVNNKYDLRIQLSNGVENEKAKLGVTWNLDKVPPDENKV